MRIQAVILFFLLAGSPALQARPQKDTVDIYGERRDSLAASVVRGDRRANFLSRSSAVRTEVITSAGLCKMACCNLAESFENSASVTVGYSDAVSGARQIRLLGQSGIYTQMLEENRPVMRGLSAPFGLGFVPSQWLESIQVAKGLGSVINGVEALTGQINLEYRKPTDEKPLFVQASMMSDTRADLNVASSLQFDDNRWSTIILAHVDGNFKSFDHNSDGFLDAPLSTQASLANRWLYQADNGAQLRFGVRGLYDRRRGGQLPDVSENPWTSLITNSSFNSYLKAGFPLSERNERNVAAVVDYTFHDFDSRFGASNYRARQHSAFMNLLFQDEYEEKHHYVVGLSGLLDNFDESLVIRGTGTVAPRLYGNAGAFGEYTFHAGDVFTLIAGVRADWFSDAGFRVSPRLTLKWSPVRQLVIRANGGRGLRRTMPVPDNIGVLSTSKVSSEALLGNNTMEDAWTFGGNISWYLPFDKSGKTVLSVDYFRTQFVEQLVWDNSETLISCYPLSAVRKEGFDAYSYSNNWQVDLAAEPLRGFTINATFRYTDARQTRMGFSRKDAKAGADVKPMTSLWKGVLNLQYATRLNKWIFDFTAAVNGPCKVWEFMRQLFPDSYKNGYTPVYPSLYAQVTRRFKGFDVYIGGENLTNFRQKNPIIWADDPWDGHFDASCVWGPLMGARVYIGVRYTLWK